MPRFGMIVRESQEMEKEGKGRGEGKGKTSTSVFGTAVYPHKPKACPTRSPSVVGTGIYRQYLRLCANLSDFGLLREQSSSNERFPAQDAPNHRAKFDTASFILAKKSVTVQTK